MGKDGDWGKQEDHEEEGPIDIAAYERRKVDTLRQYGFEEKEMWLTECTTVEDFEDYYGISDWGLEGYQGVVYHHESGSVMRLGGFNTKVEFHQACRFVAQEALDPHYDDDPSEFFTFIDGIMYVDDGSGGLQKAEDPADTPPAESSGGVDQDLVLGVATEQAIKAVRDYLLEEAQQSLVVGHIESWEDLEVILDRYPSDGTEIVQMTGDEQIDLIEAHGEEAEVTFPTVTPNNLRQAVEGAAVAVVNVLGRQDAREVLDRFCLAMEGERFEYEDITQDGYGCFRPFDVDYEAPFEVTRYRNVEGQENHFDIYEYEDFGFKVCFRRDVPDEEVTEAERRWSSV